MSSAMTVKANIATDIVAAVEPHFAPCPPILNVAVSGAPQAWAPGKLTMAHAMTRTVHHKNMPIVQEGHDQGRLLPHITVPLVGNPWYAVIHPASSRKVMFGAAKVKMDGKSMGCTAPWPPVPMLSCGDPLPVPTAVPVTSPLNTLNVGMTPADLMAGSASIIAEVAIAKIMAGRPTAMDPKKLLADCSKGLAKGVKAMLPALKGEVFNTLSPFPTKAKDWKALAAKTALDNLVGVTISGLRGNPTGKSKIGNDIIGLEIELSQKDGIKATVNGGSASVDTNGEASLAGQKR